MPSVDDASARAFASCNAKLLGSPPDLLRDMWLLTCNIPFTWECRVPWHFWYDKKVLAKRKREARSDGET